jgi:hypothetical protein
MKINLVFCTVLALLASVFPAAAQTGSTERADTRVYLADGTLVEGTMVEKGAELIIMRVEQKVFTFDRTEIDKIVTLESLGGGAKTITVTEFPYISFMGGAVAFGLLSWLQFDRASDNEQEAELNRVHQQLSRAQKLEDKASRARIYGWSTAIFSAGSLGVSLIPRKATRRVFPELGASSDGDPMLRVKYTF